MKQTELKNKMLQEWYKWTKFTPSNSLYDRSLIWLFVGFLFIGLIAVTSASIPFAISNHDDPYYFAIRDGIYVLISLSIFSVFIRVPIEKWEKHNVTLLGVVFILLIIVLLMGKNVNGSSRWIPLGVMRFQPAELAKLAFICYFSSFYVRKFNEVREQKWAVWRPSAVLALFGSLLMLQPDFGSVVVLAVLAFSILFILGAKKMQFVALTIAGLIISFVAVITSEYRLRRVTSFIDPFADALGDGYQLSNSQMAFGQGELFGKGLGNSVQKLSYLTEAHTDFIMAVIAEEFGFFGITIIVLLLCALVLKALKISRESLMKDERFKGFFAFGIGVWILFQCAVNLGMASGLLPTKGLTFPFISYGGSSLVVMSVAIAVLTRIDYENRFARIGHTYSAED